MKAILIGYEDRAGRGVMQPLYLGHDAQAAIEIQNSPPAGILKTELFRLGLPSRTRYVFEAEAVPQLPAVPELVLEDPIVPEVPVAEDLPKRGRKKDD